MRALATLLAVWAVLAATSLTQNSARPESGMVYEQPPASLHIPSSGDLESERVARGNVASWRDSERQRIGPYEFNFQTGVERRPLPGVGGYFAFFGNGALPGGVIEATWQHANAGVGEQGH